MKSEELFALLRRRGILWPAAEIYGGAQGLYDYGPAGTALKRRIEDAWVVWFVGLSDDFHLIEPSEILPEAVVRASGHLEHFTDPEVTCPKCQGHFRAETVLEKWRPEGVDGLQPAEIATLLKQYPVRCPNCGSPELRLPKPFNLMFGFDFGAAGGERAYLRPETAQGSYLSFPRMWDVGRRALPLGIAVVGKAYRNEIAPRQVLFRMRAFTQAELQIFFDPAMDAGSFASVDAEELPVLRVARRVSGESRAVLESARALVAEGLPEFYVVHLVHTYRFFRDVLRYPAETIRLFEKSDAERAFYNRIQFDVEVDLESLGGFKELGAVHYRGDYDLSRHSAGSTRDLRISRGDGRRLLPHVVELTFGVDRNLWALADIHLKQEVGRTVWQLPSYLAPVPIAVFPHIAKDHGRVARQWLFRLRSAGIPAQYDERGSIGRRYARMDEIGTPFCLTVDQATIQGTGPDAGTATLRDRDSKLQERLPLDQVLARVGARLVPPRPQPLDAAG